MGNPFQNVFIKVLKEAPELPEETGSDSAAFESQLDKGTDPSSFDVESDETAQHMASVNAIQNKMIDQLKGWIGELERFSDFLNGTTPESMQSKLSKAIPDTLFDKIRVAETKKIARVAMEIAALTEVYKGYLASSSDPKYRGV